VGGLPTFFSGPKLISNASPPLDLVVIDLYTQQQSSVTKITTVGRNYYYYNNNYVF
jgi:hypothetical protein